MEEKTTGNFHQIQNQEIIDLRQYWRILMSHKWGILGFSCITSLLVCLIVFNITPIYKGTATLLIESKKSNVVSIQEVYGIDDSNEYLSTQFEILQSRNIAQKVIDKLGLENHPLYQLKQKSSIQSFIQDTELYAFIKNILPNLSLSASVDDETTAVASKERLIDEFLSNLNVSPVKKTQLVRINYESPNAKLAADIANEIANTYIEDNLAAKLELTVKATTWLNEQLKGQRVGLTQAEERLQMYREQQGILGANGGLGMAEREINLVSTKLVDAKRELLEVKNLYDQIQKIGQNNASKLQLIPNILSHPLVQSLKDSVAAIELRRSEISDRYGKKHPKMRALNSERSRAYSNLNKQIISIAHGIENRYKVSVSAVESLEESLVQTKKDMQTLSSKEYKLKELEQDVTTKRTLYEQFYTRFSETSATGDLKTANARITDRAMPPRTAIKPNKKLIISLSFFASFMFAVMIAFLLKALDNTIKTSFEVETKLNETVFGILPLLAKSRTNPHPSYKQYIDLPHSNYSESLRTIRTGVILSSLDKPFKTISVTSTAPGEGKTSVSLGLAFTLAQLGSVLLIDADMRRPSIKNALSLDEQKLGLSDLVAQTGEMQECITAYKDGGFDVLPCGTLPPNPSELLSSQRFKDLISQLSDKYDKIILDTAPCLAVSDALVLSPSVDAYLYVVKSDSTTALNAKNGIKRLRQANANIAGIVLTQVDLKKAEQYYGEDLNGYYDNYSYIGAKA